MTDELVVAVPMCPPKGVAANSRTHWREKSRLVAMCRDAAFEATCLAIGIPAWQHSGGSWRQGPYTPPEWLRPAYAEQDRRESNRLPRGFRLPGSWRPLTPLLVVDVTIVWAAGRQRQDPTNAWHAIKSLQDGMCHAIALNDKLILPGTITQERAKKTDPEDWLHGRTTLTLRPQAREEAA